MEEDGGRGLTRLPEDLRRIAGDVEVLKVESDQLREIPPWVGEMANLRSLAAGADFEDVYDAPFAPTLFPLTPPTLTCLTASIPDCSRSAFCLRTCLFSISLQSSAALLMI